MKKSLYALTLICLGIYPLYSQDIILHKSKGKVQIYDESGKELNKNQSKYLKENYKIKTGKASQCEILLKDGTLLFVSENSELKIEKGSLLPEERDFSFDFLKGKTMFFVNQVKKKVNNVKIKTPTAVCAVRGTNFSIITSSETSDIGLFEGSLQIEKDNQIKELKPGNEAVVSTDIKISERLSAVMEKERKRAEKLAKYIESVRNKLNKRQEIIDEKMKKNEEKIDNFLKKKEK